MQLVFIGVMILGIGIVIHSLRLRGVLWFLAWMLLGMAIAFLAYQFISGTWRA